MYHRTAKPKKEYDFTFEQIAAFKTDQLRTGTRSVKYIDDDECIYRGRVIRRYDRVPTGYYGRYGVRWMRKDEENPYGKLLDSGFSKLSEAKAFIDQLIEGK